jgi:hypothetical protein
MTRRTDHARRNQRDRVRQGSEDVRGALPLDLFRSLNKPTMPVVTKAEMRATADRAFEMWSATRASS